MTLGVIPTMALYADISTAIGWQTLSLTDAVALNPNPILKILLHKVSR